MSQQVHLDRYFILAGDNYYPSGWDDFRGPAGDDKDDAIQRCKDMQKIYDWVSLIDNFNYSEVFF